MTPIIEYKLIKHECTTVWYMRAFNWLLKRENEYVFNIDLVLLNNVGYQYGNLVMFNTGIKAVVISSELNKVLVRTIQPHRAIKEPRSIKLLTRKWLHFYENLP